VLPSVIFWRGHRRLGDGLALGAGPFAANVALHAEDAGHVVHLLGHVFADAFHLAAAGAGGALGFVHNLAPWQLGRQHLAFGLLPVLGVGLGYGRCELLDLIGHGLQIGFQDFFQQTALLGAVALGLDGKLQALEQRVLLAELVDLGLTQQAILVFAGEGLRMLRNLREQPNDASTKQPGGLVDAAPGGVGMNALIA
jgi:hypothetical protein